MIAPKGWDRIRGDTYWGYHAWYRKVEAPERSSYLVEWEGKYYVCDHDKFVEAHHGKGFFRIENALINGPIETLPAAIAAYYLITGILPTERS